MEWDDHRVGYWTIYKKAERCLKRIRELESLSRGYSIDERIELNALKEEIYKIREICSHSWEKIAMFSSVMKICKMCEKEDRNYDYYDDTDPCKPKI